MVMRALELAQPASLDNFAMVRRAQPKPGPGEVLVRLSASSLNFHDYVVAVGLLPVEHGRVPLSDGAGTVEALGEGVQEFALGDRVVTTFFPDWLDGPLREGLNQRIPGDTCDGYAREYVCLPETALTRAPQGWSFAESATLTCAGVTAWSAVVEHGKVKPGDWVLVQGTGGVSIYALQIALAAGAKVIATTSSDAKAERLKEMGASHVINYVDNPHWGQAVLECTDGRGVDQVVEVGGAETLKQSIQACAPGGQIGLIGILTGMDVAFPAFALFSKQVRISGISVGSRRMQQDLVAAFEANGIRPVIDRSFPLEELGDAFRHQESGKHFGKICVEF